MLYVLCMYICSHQNRFISMLHFIGYKFWMTVWHWNWWCMCWDFKIWYIHNTYIVSNITSMHTYTQNDLIYYNMIDGLHFKLFKLINSYINQYLLEDFISICSIKIAPRYWSRVFNHTYITLLLCVNLCIVK